MNTRQKFEQFLGYHQPGNPIILYNCWDAGSAQKVVEAGGFAVATGSKPLAMAQGYADGENIPFDALLHTVGQIANSVEVPVSIDFESGYAGSDHMLLAEHTTQLLGTGIVGVNFEDQRIGVGGVYDLDTQAQRIATVRKAAEQNESPLFINARTDLFLQQKDRTEHAGLVAEAISRGQAYKQAGADGFFIPGLLDLKLISEVCSQVGLPVNVIKFPDAPSHQELAAQGVARISYGPFAYVQLMNLFVAHAADAVNSK